MPAIWAALSAVLGNLVKTQAGAWAASLLAAFGLSLVAQEFAVEPALDAIQQNIGGMPATVVAWLSYLGVDRCITTVLSAYGAASAVAGIRLRRTPSA